MTNAADKKDYKAIVANFNEKIQKALKGENLKEDTKKAVDEMLAEMGVSVKKS
ncbi:MAG: hypothetical protein ACOY46_11655 [Bacillota bacterium]